MKCQKRVHTSLRRSKWEQVVQPSSPPTHTHRRALRHTTELCFPSSLFTVELDTGCWGTHRGYSTWWELTTLGSLLNPANWPQKERKEKPSSTWPLNMTTHSLRVHRGHSDTQGRPSLPYWHDKALNKYITSVLISSQCLQTALETIEIYIITIYSDE